MAKKKKLPYDINVLIAAIDIPTVQITSGNPKDYLDKVKERRKLNPYAEKPNTYEIPVLF